MRSSAVFYMNPKLMESYGSLDTMLLPWKNGGYQATVRPLTVNPNITHTRRYSPFHQVSVLAILVFKLVPHVTLPAPHTTNDDTTHAVKE